ncbi:hypothetical protein CAPTEDRAFT_89075, partial [Capitella teleta]|uniref:PDZ domain-containing protein n=1 Tax=Capitella teleta TaxID=283909 RepID=X2BAQ0_CAPTE
LGMRVVGGKMGPDGKLGAFVTHVIKEGPADLANIMEADQILEWDGSSLEDATFEEAQQILARSGDTVQLLVMHTRCVIKNFPICNVVY